MHYDPSHYNFKCLILSKLMRNEFYESWQWWEGRKEKNGKRGYLSYFKICFFAFFQFQFFPFPSVVNFLSCKHKLNMNSDIIITTFVFHWKWLNLMRKTPKEKENKWRRKRRRDEKDENVGLKSLFPAKQASFPLSPSSKRSFFAAATAVRSQRIVQKCREVLHHLELIYISPSFYLLTRVSFRVINMKFTCINSLRGEREIRVGKDSEWYCNYRKSHGSRRIEYVLMTNAITHNSTKWIFGLEAEGERVRYTPRSDVQKGVVTW